MSAGAVVAKSDSETSTSRESATSLALDWAASS